MSTLGGYILLSSDKPCQCCVLPAYKEFDLILARLVPDSAGKRKRAIRESYLSALPWQWMWAGYLEDISVIYEGDSLTWGSQFSAIFHNAELQDKCAAE